MLNITERLPEYQSEMERNKLNIYIYKVEKKIQTDSRLSLQACFVVAHSSGDLIKIYFTIAYIQSNIHNNSSSEAKLNIYMSAIA